MTAVAVADRPVAPEAMLETVLDTRSMGGGLRLLVASAASAGDAAERDVRQAAARVDAWAQRLTRFSPTSELSYVNAEPARSPLPVRPTMAAALQHAAEMAAASEGTVDISLLDARLAAETNGWLPRNGPAGWHLRGHGRRHELVRTGPVRFDLDGVAKGWIADRALGLLETYPCALVDADGDVAVRASWSAGWGLDVAHPAEDAELARLRIPRGWHTDRFGVATSGTSIHRWSGPDGTRHHLIDPRTSRPAVTDVVQATVVAASAGLAETMAKAAVIRGSHDGPDLLDRAGAWAAVLLLDDGTVLVTPETSRWMA